AVRWRGLYGERRTSSIVTISIAHVSDTHVIQGIGLSNAKHDRRTGLQRTSIRLVSCPMLVEESVPATNRCLATTGWIPGETQARSKVEQMPGHAARGCSVYTTLNQAHILHDPLIELKC